MNEQKSCPICKIHNPIQARICKNCGADMILAKLVAENSISDSSLDGQRVSVSPEILIPKVGNYLVERGAISKADLRVALAYQKEKTKINSPILLGEALVELDLIDRKILDKAITEQIFDLQNALKESNLRLEHRVNERTEELQNALHKLTELNQLKTNFVATISHELRTPLTHMAGYLNLLQDEVLGPISKEQNNAIQIICKAYDRLFTLIEDLIQFSLVSQGNISLNKKPIQVSELMEQTITNLQASAKKNNIHLTYKNCDDTILINADQEKISWTLNQILENAIKFNQNSGIVFLKTNIEKDIISFIIQDDGIGIEAKNIDLIFEPFYQLDNSSTRKYGGTGIGLSLVKQILNAHGSTVEVTSKLGVGSVFKFSLPITNYETN